MTAGALALAPVSALAAAPSASIDEVVWQFIRASGIVAYALLSASVFLGLAVRTRALEPALKRAHVFEGHQFMSLVAAGMTAVHVGFLLLNSHVPFTMLSVLIPFASAWRPIPSALGTLAMWLIAMLLVTSYGRRRIGQKVWRALHFSGFLAWGIALLHGLTAGSDTGLPWMQLFYLGTSAPVVLLIAFRVLVRSGQSRPKPRPAQRERTLASERLR